MMWPFKVSDNLRELRKAKFANCNGYGQESSDQRVDFHSNLECGVMAPGLLISYAGW
jgi:hypothetical protein